MDAATSDNVGTEPECVKGEPCNGREQQLNEAQRAVAVQLGE